MRPIYAGMPEVTSASLARRLAAGMVLATLCAAPARADELADLINAYRAAPGACQGRPALPGAPLTPEPALAAIRVGAATFLESALSDAGFEASRAEAISVNGPADAHAALAAIQQTYCPTLLSKDFDAIGTARRGNQWQIVLAKRLAMPALPDWEQAGQEILALVNATRAQPRTCGSQTYRPAPPLTWNADLGQAALAHSSNMAQFHYFNHQEADGSVVGDRASRARYRWGRIGENIASGQRSVEEAVAGWLDSPGHCSNIMDPGFTEMGAAYAINPQNRNRTPYWTQVFARPPGP
jgi:uncharacterized protein YkwD